MADTEFYQGDSRLVLGLWPAFLSLISCGFAFFILQPGMMSYDSLVNWKMSQTLALSDSHPPIYALLLAVIRVLWDSPAAVVAINLVVFGIGASLLAEIARSKSLLIVSLPPLSLFFPFVLNFVGVLWKDSALAVCWWAAVAIAAYLMVNREAGVVAKWLMFAGALVFFVIGTLCRYNSITSAPFLLSMLILPVLSHSWAGRPWKIFIVSCVACAATLWGLSAVINKVFHVRHSYVFDSIIVYDLAGISKITGFNAFPVGFDSEQLQRINACYRPTDWNTYAAPTECGFVVGSIERAQLWGVNRLTLWWLSQIAQHPVAYARHRMQVFGSFLRLGYPDSYYVIHPGIDENDFGLSHPDSILFNMFKDYVLYKKDAFFMRPWFWLLVNSLIVTVSMFSRREPLRFSALLVSLSGMVYILTYLVFGIASDFRYAYWAILSALAAFFILISTTKGSSARAIRR